MERIRHEHPHSVCLPTDQPRGGRKRSHLRARSSLSGWVRWTKRSACSASSARSGRPELSQACLTQLSGRAVSPLPHGPFYGSLDPAKHCNPGYRHPCQQQHYACNHPQPLISFHPAVAKRYHTPCIPLRGQNASPETPLGTALGLTLSALNGRANSDFAPQVMRLVAFGNNEPLLRHVRIVPAV